LSLLFLASGMAALIYQVAWQRVLFAAFGADLESVTIIVSAFMLGLGIGALAGGLAADRWPRSRLSLFAASEAGIGIFGISSPFLLFWAGQTFVNWPLYGIASVNFLLVLLPTMLMGATLPILIAHVTQRLAHVGAATGHLYALNTLGAALGSVAAGFWLFHHLTLNQSIWLAATVNLGAAVLAYWKLRDPGRR
jgi:predicted membrane-bound spermidine synthase